MRDIPVFLTICIILLHTHTSILAQDVPRNISQERSDTPIQDQKSENNIPSTEPDVDQLVESITDVSARSEMHDETLSNDVTTSTEPVVADNIDVQTPIQAIDLEKSTDPAQNVSSTQIISETSDHLMTSANKDNIPLSDDILIRLNEILPDPLSGDEFIELYNNGDEALNLNQWRLCDTSTFDDTLQKCDLKKKSVYIFPSTMISPHSHLTLYAKSHFSFVLNNSSENIILEDASGNIVMQIAYKTSHKGLSWNYDISKWYEETPTPNTLNTPNPLTKNYPALRINEIFPHPHHDQEKNEFIEIYNPLDVDVSLDQWILKDASKTGSFTFSQTSFSPCKQQPDTCLTILKNGFITIYRSDFSFALNDSGTETVTLFTPNNKPTSVVTYEKTRESLSLNYTCDQWYWTDPTPQKENFLDPRMQSYPQLFLSEVLPNPSIDETAAEYIELYNPSEDPVDLKNWSLHDASTSGNYTFSTSTLIQPSSYFVIYRSDFLFALNNTHETISLIAPNEKIVHTTHYAASRENVSYNYDLSTNGWRWSKYLTPAADNMLNSLPIIDSFTIPSIAYIDVYTEFSAQASDKNNEKLSVRWEFGDDRRSYLWATRHKYLIGGIYHGTLRIQDESEEVLQNFMITVKKYPKHRLKITGILPNPSGKDTGTEYLTIKNTSSKTLDLKNWSIATGTNRKRLVNHPITQHLFLKKGAEKIITRTDAAITLPNTTGVIELRRPDGSVADILSYGTENETIPDNALYSYDQNLWSWSVPFDMEKKRKAHAIIMSAIENEKKLRDKKKEAEIAHAKIHTQRDARKTIAHSHMLWVDHLTQKYNKFLTQIITISSQYALFTLFSPHVHSQVTTHTIAQAQDRCAITPIFDIKHTLYDLCAYTKKKQ